MTKIDFPISQRLAFEPIHKFMNPKAPYTLTGATVRTAMQTMVAHNAGGLPVLDNTMKCLGYYSEMDAILQGASQSLDSPIRYQRPPKVVSETATFREVLIELVAKRLKSLPVVGARNQWVGMVSRKDLLRALLEDHSNESKK